MNEILRSYLKELSLPGRIEILKILSEKPMNVASIHKELESIGIRMPLSTVSRCMNSLAERKIVRRKDDGHYYLTGLGYLIVDKATILDDILSLKELLWDADEFSKILPPELKMGLTNLKKVEIEPDFLAAVAKGIKVNLNTMKWAKVIDRNVSYDLFEITIRNILRGVNYKVLSSSDTISRRLEITAKIIRDLNLSDEEIEIIKKNAEVRVLDLPFQVYISDGKIAFLQIINGKSEPPIFISENKDFIRWTEKLFDYFWESAELIDFPSALDDSLSKITCSSSESVRDIQ